MRSLTLVLVAFLVVMLWAWWLPTTAFARWQRQHLYWNYGVQVLFFVIPLAALATRTGRATDYGLPLTNPAFHLRLLLALAAVLVLVPLTVHGLSGGGLAPARTFVAHPVSTLVFHVVFSSFGEELFFRGFAQGEVNRGLGRPWRLGAVQFGPGLVIATVAFALGHVPGNHHSLGTAAGAFVFAGCFAFFAGVLRERTGGIWAPFALHGCVDFNVHVFQQSTGFRLAGFLCTGFAFWLVMALVFRTPAVIRALGEVGENGSENRHAD